ncbi:MAG: hypothetical protein KBT69_12050, partial [Oceanihabitans sp.]|nr:hypothetical protein [Oceanihabitans sp.]
MRNYQLKSIVFCFLFFGSITSSFAQINKNSFIKYIDSANNAFDENPKLARLYLDSIPQPVEKNIEGHVADYFKLRGIINDRFNNRAELFQNFLLALKYAKIENNYDIAGMASVELFYNKYFIQSDSISAFNYLNEAKVYYRKGNNINGLADVKQMYAYVQLNEGNYDKSNKLILQDLSEYKAIKDDGYYYMYALFMLSSNYIHQEDLYNSHKYFNRLKTLKKDTTIT